jgi:pimeloyl-ACP methyl ester carboxylesterase
MKAARRYTASDGLSLHYTEWSPGYYRRAPDILCLPGLTRHSADFDDVAARLAGYGHRVIGPDLRGRGRSDYARDVSSYAPPQYLDDLRALTIAARLDRFVVIGTSFGGLLAMALATMLPSQIAGIAINDIGPDIATDGAQRILDYIAVDRPQPDWDAAARALRDFLPDVLANDEIGWAKLVRNTYRQGDDGLLHYDWDVKIAANLKAGGDPEIDLWALWRGLGALPALVVRGAKSDVLSAETFARMKTAKPDLMQVEIPDTGHAPTLDEPVCQMALAALLAKSIA